MFFKPVQQKDIKYYERQFDTAIKYQVIGTHKKYRQSNKILCNIIESTEGELELKYRCVSTLSENYKMLGIHKEADRYTKISHLLFFELVRKTKAEDKKHFRVIFNIGIFIVMIFCVLIFYMTRLKISNKMHEELYKEKDSTINILSHDVKTNIRNIHFSISQMEKNKNFNVDNIDAIKNSTKTLYNLINSLVEWSRLRNKTIIKEHVNLIMFINGLSNDRIKLISNIKFIYTDKEIIEIILKNVISNALKFSSNDVIVTVKNNFFKYIISVEDTGIGMNSEQLEKIKHRAVHTTNGLDGEPGHGIGLIFTNDYIKTIGGKLSINSIDGIGSKVLFTIEKQWIKLFKIYKIK